MRYPSFLGNTRRTALFVVFALVLFPIARTLADGEYILLSTYSGAPGSALTVQGFGFPSGAASQVNFQGLSTTATAASDGTFTTTPFVVPTRPAGSYAVTAAVSGGASVQTSFYIQGFFPSASPSEWWVTPGQMVGFNAEHFAPGEQVNVYLNGSATSAGNATADAGGEIHATNVFRAPASSANRQLNVALIGQSSGASAQFSIAVGGFYPNASPTAYYATPGQTVGVTGGGYAPSESLVLREGSTDKATFSTDAAGNFSALTALNIPFGSEGSHDYTVTGLVSGAVASFPLTVGGIFPQARPTAYFALPGERIGVIASDFGPGETVRLLDATDREIATASADSTGNVTGLMTAILVPYGSNGSLSYRVVGDQSRSSASFGFSVGGFDPQIDPSTWYTAPGKLVRIVGRGYGPNETVAITGGSAVVNATTDGNGNFTASVRAPLRGTNFTITATGGSSNGSAARTIGIAQDCIIDDAE